MSLDEHRKKERERKRLYRARHRTFRVTYTRQEAKGLEREAGKYNKSVPEFLKALVSAHKETKGYILPPDNNLHELIFLLRKIGNNINQHTRHVNASKEVRYIDIERLQNHLLDIEKVVTQSLTQPQAITEVLEEYLRQNPEKLQALIKWLNHYQP